MKKYCLIFLLCLVGVFSIDIHISYASGFIDSIILPYKQASHNIASSVLIYAKRLFWILAGIQFIGSSIKIALQNGDIQEWAAHLVRQIIFIGIYAWLMENSFDFSMTIIDSFRHAASYNSIRPSGVLDIGMMIVNVISSNSSIFHPFDSVLYAIACIVIIIAFAWISALVVVALCEMYILIGAGVLLMGFGGSEWTRDFANKNLMMSMSIGAKLFIMEILINIGFEVMQQWANVDYSSNYSNLWQVIAGSVVFVLLTMHLPNMAQQFISGAATGSTAAQGIRAMTQAAVTSALAATGVGMAGAAALKASGNSLGASPLATGINALRNFGGANQSSMILSSKMGGQGMGSKGIGLQQIGGGGSAGGDDINQFNSASMGGSASNSSSTVDSSSASNSSSTVDSSSASNSSSMKDFSTNSNSASTASSVGSNLGKAARVMWQGLKQEATGRISGTGIRGGTIGGRVAQYIKDSQLQINENSFLNNQKSQKQDNDEQNTIL